MTKSNYPGEQAYDSHIAATYESDRIQEDIWGREQVYMDRVVSEMQEGSLLLDAPVGSGRFFPYYQSRHLQVLGLDISCAMLNEAKKKVAEGDTIRLAVGDARALDAPDCTFDYVVCWRLMHLLPDEVLGLVIAELGRVVVKRIYLQAYVRDELYYPLRVHRIVNRIFSKVLGNEKTKPTPWRHIQSFSHKQSRLLELFRVNGLRLRSIDVLGIYGALRVKVYVLEKT